MNAFLIHGTGSSPDEGWYPWLKRELENEGHDVFVPAFPTPEGQSLQSWLDLFKHYEKRVDRDSVFIGRSIGPAFILQVLQRLKTRISAAFLVAGFVSDIGKEEFRPLIHTFVDAQYDWQKMKAQCKTFFVYHADNDMVVDVRHGRELAAKLGVPLRVVPGAGHFNGKTFPRLLEDLKSVL